MWLLEVDVAAAFLNRCPFLLPLNEPLVREVMISQNGFLRESG